MAAADSERDAEVAAVILAVVIGLTVGINGPIWQQIVITVLFAVIGTPLAVLGFRWVDRRRSAR